MISLAQRNAKIQKRKNNDGNEILLGSIDFTKIKSGCIITDIPDGKQFSLETNVRNNFLKLKFTWIFIFFTIVISCFIYFMLNKYAGIITLIGLLLSLLIVAHFINKKEIWNIYLLIFDIENEYIYRCMRSNKNKLRFDGKCHVSRFGGLTLNNKKSKKSESYIMIKFYSSNKDNETIIIEKEFNIFPSNPKNAMLFIKNVEQYCSKHKQFVIDGLDNIERQKERKKKELWNWILKLKKELGFEHEHVKKLDDYYIKYHEILLNEYDTLTNTKNCYDDNEFRDVLIHNAEVKILKNGHQIPDFLNDSLQFSIEYTMNRSLSSPT